MKATLYIHKMIQILPMTCDAKAISFADAFLDPFFIEARQRCNKVANLIEERTSRLETSYLLQ